MVRRPAGWLLLPLALIFATALAEPQLLFLGYDLRELLDPNAVRPLPAPAEGLTYVFDGEGSEVYATAGHEDNGFKLGYEISDLVLLVTPPTLARHRL
jgi:hypothetical protein